jgi:hypothetical protein
LESNNNNSKTSDELIVPSKEDLLAYKKGKYSIENIKGLEITKNSSKKDKTDDDEPKIEVY